MMKEKKKNNKYILMNINVNNQYYCTKDKIILLPVLGFLLSLNILKFRDILPSFDICNGYKLFLACCLNKN